MNTLPRKRQRLVIQLLVEGSSIPSISRVTRIHRDTISRLLLRVGDQCAKIHDRYMQDLKCECLQLDETWSFVQKKEWRIGPDDPAEYGDTYLFIALDPHTKLVPAYLAGKRDEDHMETFIDDLAGRLAGGRVQITTDGYGSYLPAIESRFGDLVDYATLVKTLASDAPLEGRRRSAKRLQSSNIWGLLGTPRIDQVSTSHVERLNLDVRMCNRRCTRYSNGFSKRLRHHRAQISLFFAWYNFVRIHGAIGITPAMAAQVASGLWDIDRLLPPRPEDTDELTHEIDN